MPKNLKAAIVQAAPVLFDTLRTIAKVADQAREATELGAELLAFPEAFVGPKGIDFGARLGMQSPEGREDFRRYYEKRHRIAQRWGRAPGGDRPGTTASIL